MAKSHKMTLRLFKWNLQFTMTRHLRNIWPNQLQMQSQPHLCFINKGNTCHDNSILQVLSVMATPWNRISSESSPLSPILCAISLNMAVKKNSTNPVDSCNFLWTLIRKLSNSHLISNTQKITVSCNTWFYSSLSLVNFDILIPPVSTHIHWNFYQPVCKARDFIIVLSENTRKTSLL